MPLYVCDGCWDDIPVLKARIHCQECEDFDLCANCFVVKRYNKTHNATHRTLLEERSGLMPRSEGDPPSSTTSPTSTIVTTSPSSTSPAQVTIQAPIHSPIHIPVYSPIRDPVPVPVQVRTPASIPVENIHIFQPHQGLDITGNADNWQPLFENTQPTQMMVDLLTAIFICLDTSGTRLLAPEQYSSFLEVQGYVVDEDVWKRNIKPQYGYNPEDIADFELRTAYENFSIDHTIQTRQSALNKESPFQPLLSPISGGQMPMLSLRGFIDITTVETLGEPTVGWQRLNLAKQYYEVWPEWGLIPRRVVPDYPPQELLDRVAQISAFAQRQAAERMEARRAKSVIREQERWDAQMMQDQSQARYGYR